MAEAICALYDHLKRSVALLGWTSEQAGRHRKKRKSLKKKNAIAYLKGVVDVVF
jgi:hypothetical protein